MIDMINSKIEIGIIGAGGITAATHLPLLSSINNIKINNYKYTYNDKYDMTI